MVAFTLCEGNTGALAFMMEAYMEHDLFRAERGFQRMQDNGISGSRLYMLWNDCCDKDTKKAVDIMCEYSIGDIIQHINYSGGRGIPFD